MHLDIKVNSVLFTNMFMVLGPGNYWITRMPGLDIPPLSHLSLALEYVPRGFCWLIIFDDHG